METKAEALKSHIAIRCAKAAILVSSLNRNRNLRIHRENEEMLKKKVENLQFELVRERMKNKRLKFCNFADLVFQIMLMLMLMSFLVVMFFEF